MAFSGNCHCSAVRFSVEADLPEMVVSCNCSHCRQKGFLLSFFPASKFRLERGAEVIESYSFNTGKLAHKFCKICGTQPFAEGKSSDGTDTRAVNMRCVPEADLEAFRVQPFNGAAL